MRTQREIEATALGPEADPPIALEGVVDRVVFANEDSAWAVVRIEVPGRAEPITAVGNLLGLQAGESVRLRGGWMMDKKFGEQFRALSYVTLKPATLVGIEKYLGSGLIAGIGKVMAKRMVDRFGLATLDVIDSDADRLREVDGIGPVRAERIQKAWIDQRAIHDVMVFLQAHAISASFAVRIFRHYRERAVAVVKENPYRLAIDIHGIGFRTADKIAFELGIKKDSPARAEAGVLHVLGEASGDGHVFLPRDPLIQQAAALLEIDEAHVDVAIERLLVSGDLVADALYSGGVAIYLLPLFRAERSIASGLRRLLDTPPRPLEIDLERALLWFEARAQIALSAEQRRAIQSAILSKLLVVTGGPGTGKTTLIRGIIQILEKKRRRVVLCAPTGRAAKRMSEATDHEAKTLHRLLEFQPKSGTFARNQDRPLDADVVIIDEASMIDTPLMAHLVRALFPTTALILVGDVDQLPSVGPGRVLFDVIASQTAEVVKLKQIFRQAEQSDIVVNAHRINDGDMPLLREKGCATDFYFIERDEPEEVLSTIVRLVSERLPAKFGFDPIRDIQVLAPMNRGMLGTQNFNSALQACLNPTGDAWVRGGRVLRIGDKVMQVRNNYDLDVYNGDIGRIESMDETERTVVVGFDGRRVTYDAMELDDLVLAYASSIHRAQGSEVACVVIPIHTQHYVMLQRNLLYTAVTRGRKLVVLVGTKRALAIAIRNRQAKDRWTLLGQRLSGLKAVSA